MDEQAYQTKVRNTAVPTVYLLLCKHNTQEILLALRQGTGYQDGKWELPAGHVDGGELPLEAMTREAKEEIGITIKESDLTLVHTSYRPMHDKTGNRVDFIFTARNWASEPVICEPDKCGELRWFNIRQLPKDTVPHIREFIKSWIRRLPYSEFDLEWLKENGLYKL